MKLKPVVCAVMVLTVASANFAFAQTRSNAEERQRYLDTGVDNRAAPSNRAEAREYRRNDAAAGWAEQQARRAA